MDEKNTTFHDRLFFLVPLKVVLLLHGGQLEVVNLAVSFPPFWGCEGGYVWRSTSRYFGAQVWGPTSRGWDPERRKGVGDIFRRTMEMYMMGLGVFNSSGVVWGEGRDTANFETYNYATRWGGTIREGGAKREEDDARESWA